MKNNNRIAQGKKSFHSAVATSTLSFVISIASTSIYAQAIERVSVADDGSELTSQSFGNHIISGNGRHTCFRNSGQLFVRDRVLGTTELVSVAADGTPGNKTSALCSLSDDGRYVSFRSDSTNLVPNDTNEQYDIFVYDRETKLMERVNISDDGTQANSYSSPYMISGTGR